MEFSPFSATFDGRNRLLNRGPGWMPLASLGGGHHYDPGQPRVPAGHSDGGQWARVRDGKTPTLQDERSRRLEQPSIRVASQGIPRLPGWLGATLTLLLETLLALIRHHRKENAPSDLFGDQKDLEDGTIASTIIDGKSIIGMNRNYPSYTGADYGAAKRLRNVLIRKYPDEMATDNIGRIPNDALFHAETTVLLRAAKANGGTLAGKTMEVLVDKPMCFSCKGVLPYVGLELGNPTVTFTESRTGVRRTMRDGKLKIIEGPGS